MQKQSQLTATRTSCELYLDCGALSWVATDRVCSSPTTSMNLIGLLLRAHIIVSSERSCWRLLYGSSDAILNESL